MNADSQSADKKTLETGDQKIKDLFAALPRPRKHFFLREISSEDLPSKGEKEKKKRPDLEDEKTGARPMSPCPPWIWIYADNVKIVFTATMIVIHIKIILR